MKRPSILLADDHRIITEGLRNLIEPEFRLVGIVEDGRALVETAKQLKPDVIVADISMPLLNGIEAVRQIKQLHEHIKVVFLTMHPDMTYAVSAFEAGASGYVLKHSAPSELNAAIREALKGKRYITPLLSGAEKLLVDLKNRSGKGCRDTSNLTPRQKEVLQLLAEGFSAKEVAAQLNVSTRTIEYHKYKMMKDIGVATVADLVRYAVKFHIISE